MGLVSSGPIGSLSWSFLGPAVLVDHAVVAPSFLAVAVKSHCVREMAAPPGRAEIGIPVPSFYVSQLTRVHFSLLVVRRMFLNYDVHVHERTNPVFALGSRVLSHLNLGVPDFAAGVQHALVLFVSR